ncbi:MAG: OmpA family protein [Desulfobacterales bacterium]|nr:OmpA family protein [Desulfobacterales bacterium]
MKKNCMIILLFVIISTLAASCTKVIVKEVEVIKYKEVSPPAIPGASPLISQKVDNFIIIVDASGSMDDIYMGKKKLDYATETASRLNQAIPSMTLMGAVRRYGKGRTLSSVMKTQLVYGPAYYSKEGFENALGTINIASGLTFMESAISAVEDDVRSKGGRTAVILISDGKVRGKKGFRVKDPVQAAERLNSIFGDCLCIYTVFIPSHNTCQGDTCDDQKVMEKIARASQCGFSVSADDLTSGRDLDIFVHGIFTGDPDFVLSQNACPPREDVYATGKDIVTEKVREVHIPIFEAPPDLKIEFDFAKSKVKPIYHSQIKKIADYLNSHPGIRITIEGHTDSIGSQKYNLRLSKKRATNVRQYLIKHFKIEGSRIDIKWYGESKPVSDNKTESGRQKNRRAVTISIIR